MGYLDRQSRVVDFVLTERGRKLYASGQLDFVYFAVFDDGIDYDPYCTGTLSESERQEQIEALPMLEAPFVRDVRAAVSPLEPRSHLFTAASGYRVVPHVGLPAGDPIDLQADQSRDGASYRRAGTSLAQIDLELVGDTEPDDPGFSVRVFVSGSAGYSPLVPRRDVQGRRAVDPFVALSVDDEGVPDPVADVRRPHRPPTVKR